MYTLQLQLKLISCRSVCYKLSWLLKWNYSCIFLCCCLIPSHHVCVTGIVFLPDSISYLIASNACGHLIQQNSGRCVDRAKKLRGLSEFVQRKEAEILYWDPLEWCFERSKWLFFFFFQNKCIYLFEFEKCLSNFFVVFVPNIPRGQCSPCLYNFNLISQVAICLYWNDRSWNNHDFCESKGLHKKQNFRLKPQMQCKYVGIILK